MNRDCIDRNRRQEKGKRSRRKEKGFLRKMRTKEQVEARAWKDLWMCTYVRTSFQGTATMRAQLISPFSIHPRCRTVESSRKVPGYSRTRPISSHLKSWFDRKGIYIRSKNSSFRFTNAFFFRHTDIFRFPRFLFYLERFVSGRSIRQGIIRFRNTERNLEYS